MITIFEKDWGALTMETSWNKVDFLPRITATGIDHAFIFNAGFLMLSLNLTIWDRLMRDFNRRNRRRNGTEHISEVFNRMKNDTL